ncbi:unnamed protein product [Mycena citricolor]|uniref:Uncharacterized protein n=1 Tax=Mycena citricolor TaxID=2018698 RepID=A0AAD2GY48_9AGAR|nr:unnamed protein product [Mycena citricolor]
MRGWSGSSWRLSRWSRSSWRLSRRSGCSGWGRGCSGRLSWRSGRRRNRSLTRAEGPARSPSTHRHRHRQRPKSLAVCRCKDTVTSLDYSVDGVTGGISDGADSAAEQTSSLSRSACDGARWLNWKTTGYGTCCTSDHRGSSACSANDSAGNATNSTWSIPCSPKNRAGNGPSRCTTDSSYNGARNTTSSDRCTADGAHNSAWNIPCCSKNRTSTRCSTRAARGNTNHSARNTSHCTSDDARWTRSRARQRNRQVATTRNSA